MSDVTQGSGWWQASDGQWYPPAFAPGGTAPGGTTPDGRSNPGPVYGNPGLPATWAGAGQHPPRRSGDLADMFALVLLSAASLRIVAAVVGAIIGWTRLPEETYGRQVGDTLDWLAGFADGQGVALLLAILGLLWWHVARFEQTGDFAEATTRLGNTRRNLLWLSVLFTLTVAGTALGIIGNVVYYAGDGPQRIIWQHFVGTGGFYLSYLLIAAGGLVVTRRLSGVLARSKN
jgi:hypothetical protein